MFTVGLQKCARLYRLCLQLGTSINFLILKRISVYNSKQNTDTTELTSMILGNVIINCT